MPSIISIKQMIYCGIPGPIYCAAEFLSSTQRGVLQSKFIVRSTYQQDRKRVPTRKVLLVGYG